MTTSPSAASGVASERTGEALLEIRDLSCYNGNLAAVQGLNLDVRKGEIVTVIGSNGAGKSTTLRTISGLMKPRRGTIAFAGSRINGRPGNEIVSRGICHSPEGRRIFPKMTVDENLDLGAFLRNDRAAVAATRAHVLELFPRLAERINQKAGTMSGGEQQMLAVARAMMGKPKLLLLDEPSMGLAPVLVDLIFDTIERIRDEGTTVLLIEQNALAALRVADYAYVMESGRLKLEGPARALSEDEGIVNAYLGGG
jgi:branched-chain amino acid transport system ATP-binding protein